MTQFLSHGILNETDQNPNQLIKIKENNMLSNAKTPEDYIDQLDNDWRRKTLMCIRAIILSHAPAMQERMHYKMLGYCIGEDFVFHLNVQKAYVSLYVGDASKIDPCKDLLAGLNVGKGCIRFKKSIDVSETRIDQFIARTVCLLRENRDIDC